MFRSAIILAGFALVYCNQAQAQHRYYPHHREYPEPCRQVYLHDRYEDCHFPRRCSVDVRRCFDCPRCERDFRGRCPYDRVVPRVTSCRNDARYDLDRGVPIQPRPIVPIRPIEPRIGRIPPKTDRPPVPATAQPKEADLPPGDVPPYVPISPAPREITRLGR